MIDLALEQNRRVAWAKFFAQRSETQATMIWAGELVEWLERFAVDQPYPGVLQELVDQVRSRLSANDLAIISKYVTYQLSPSVLRSGDG